MPLVDCTSSVSDAANSLLPGDNPTLLVFDYNSLRQVNRRLLDDQVYLTIEEFLDWAEASDSGLGADPLTGVLVLASVPRTEQLPEGLEYLLSRPNVTSIIDDGHQMSIERKRSLLDDPQQQLLRHRAVILASGDSAMWRYGASLSRNHNHLEVVMIGSRKYPGCRWRRRFTGHVMLEEIAHQLGENYASSIPA